MGLRDPPYRPHGGWVCPRKSTNFIYYPRVTVLLSHLTEIIPLMTAPKAGTNTSIRYRIRQPEQPKGGTTGKQPAVASSRDGFLREMIRKEHNIINIRNQIYYFR